MKYIRISPNVEYSTDTDFFLENQIICIVSKEGTKFCSLIESGGAESLTGIDASVESHVMALAAEASRLRGGETVVLAEKDEADEDVTKRTRKRNRKRKRKPKRLL